MPDVACHDWRTYITIELPCKVEPHQAEDNAGEGQHSCGDIHDKRPSPWSLSGINLPFKVKRSYKFPSIPGINGGDRPVYRENSHINPSTGMHKFNEMAFPEDTSVHTNGKVPRNEPYISKAYCSDGIVYN